MTLLTDRFRVEVATAYELGDLDTLRAIALAALDDLDKAAPLRASA